MRCFFMRTGRICAVEDLQPGPDEQLIGEARRLFQDRGAAKSADGFEVWDHGRFVYRFVADATPEEQAVSDGVNGLAQSVERLLRTLWSKRDFEAYVLRPGWTARG